jgi:hypothetical protein
MVALVLASVLTQPYDQMPGLEKMCSIFLYYPKKIIFCVRLSVWEKKKKPKNVTILYVVMFGDGKRLAHCNAHTWKQVW